MRNSHLMESKKQGMVDTEKTGVFKIGGNFG